ncbi:serine/threonine-protein kinase [Nocardia sp. NPDC005978]|uniref:serine/threonine-protein kinase n=1 Tax=Nocardia sp. NPDC005978 TaxID=3156725 RepID=UPI0033BC1D3B
MEASTFGHYDLHELIGEGGMGRVYRAYDTTTDRFVALKVLHEHTAADPAFRERFRREAHAAARLREPHVVPIHRYGEIEGRLYLDMRLIEGTDLQTLLARHGPLDPEAAVAAIDQIAAALDAAHAAGLVHRDIKPANVLVGDRNFVYLIDFGIARAEGEPPLTTSGSAIGTFAYMAPEQFSTGHASAQSDVYALACVLHEALTGARPFPGDSLEQQVSGHLMTPAPRPSRLRPGLPPGLDAAIIRAMSKHPEDRYASAGEFAAAARRALHVPGRRVNRAAQAITAPAARILPPAAVEYRSADAAYRSARTAVAPPPPVATAPPSVIAPPYPTPLPNKTFAPTPPKPRRRGVLWAAVALLTIAAVIGAVYLFTEPIPESDPAVVDGTTSEYRDTEPYPTDSYYR